MNSQSSDVAQPQGRDTGPVGPRRSSALGMAKGILKYPARLRWVAEYRGLSELD
jgi:hypothetical protein